MKRRDMVLGSLEALFYTLPDIVGAWEIIVSSKAPIIKNHVLTFIPTAANKGVVHSFQGPRIATTNISPDAGAYEKRSDGVHSVFVALLYDATNTFERIGKTEVRYVWKAYSNFLQGKGKAMVYDANGNYQATFDVSATGTRIHV